eukprot:gene7515-biopygen22545
MDGHGTAGAACIPPQNKQRVTRCRRHCVTSRGEALRRLPWCEQVRRGPKRTPRMSLRTSEESPRVHTPQSGSQSQMYL